MVWTLFSTWIRWNIKFQTWWWLWPVLLLIKTSRLSFLSKSTLSYAGFMCIRFLIMWNSRNILLHTHTLSDASVTAQFYLLGGFNAQSVKKHTVARWHARAPKFSRLAQRWRCQKMSCGLTFSPVYLTKYMIMFVF